jgi:hypothetical protein
MKKKINKNKSNLFSNLERAKRKKISKFENLQAILEEKRSSLQRKAFYCIMALILSEHLLETIVKSKFAFCILNFKVCFISHVKHYLNIFNASNHFSGCYLHLGVSSISKCKNK